MVHMRCLEEGLAGTCGRVVEAFSHWKSQQNHVAANIGKSAEEAFIQCLLLCPSLG